MNVEAYLKRIKYSQKVKPDLATLNGLVQAQLSALPFENLDQQMGVKVSTAVNRVYEKVVIGNRGGWCFELNGLLGWALKEIGFDVTMLAAHVGSDKPEMNEANDHMLLLVNCGGSLLVDVGFGGGPIEPIPLRPITLSQRPYKISISKEGDGFYRYAERAGGNEGSYWFTLTEVDTDYFDGANHRLQSDPNSPFRRTLTAQRRLKNKHIVLRGLVKKTIDETGTKTELLSDEKELVECLLIDFNLDVPGISTYWPTIRLRHQELFGT
ncbi:arylamine N-acetyltransferase [Roseovarius sp. EL26]|uniref:arylamine N-acetyltransferase family protein n=1 Tax=Roseovarius sp. EL26 TaxID=2126672 RepID=UPI000EA13C0D|nr:arylamine N-acetyltransferase [Roseovarius sp. EL26]